MRTPIPIEELAVFNNLDGIKVVFDVGSRDDIDMYLLRPHYEYHLFEPHLPFFNELKSKVNAPNVHLNNFGFSDKQETVIYDSVAQSFAVLTDGEKFAYGLTTIDEYVKEKNVKVDFLKIDAEGMDYKILLGAKETLKNVKYVQVEYWDGARKFYDLLKDEFDLYLMMEPRLREVAIRISGDEKYKKTMLPLDVDFVDAKLIPTGSGGNILGIRK